MLNKNKIILNIDNKTYKLRALFIIILIAYLVYLAYLTFFDQLYGRESFHRSVNLIPFKTIIHYIVIQNDINIVIINIAGNIAAFLPMGFLLPLVLGKTAQFLKVMSAVLIATVTIELLQYAYGVGVTDIDDVILNILGGGLGYLLNRAVIKACLEYRKA